MRLVIICLLLVLAESAYSTGKIESITTAFEAEAASKARGYEFRVNVNEAWKLVEQRKFKLALLKSDEIIASFKHLFDKSKKQYAFQSDIEYKEFIKSNDDNFQRIDWSYREALFLKAFVYSSSKKFTDALKAIEKIETVAPVSVGSTVEKGYIQAQLKMYDKSYETYHRANELADTYPSQYVFKAAALRGMGFVLIEKNQLDNAEILFKQSLAIEPDNKTALNEIQYINRLRNK